MTLALMAPEAIAGPVPAHGLRVGTRLPLRGLEPIGICVDCTGEVFIDGEVDGGAAAHCEGCGRGWLIGVVVKVSILEEGGGAKMRGP